MRKLFKVLILSLGVFTVYIVYTGSVKLYDIATGVIVSLIVSYLTANIVIEDWRKALDLRRVATFVKFAFRYLLIDEVKAHALVIRLGLSPRLSLKPAIVKIPINSRSDYAVTMISLAITNTPGTVVVDLTEDNSVLYVHWIYATKIEPQEAYKEVCEVFDSYARKVFD